MIENIPKILVVGDLMIDHYLWGSANRISPEAPVQIIDIDRESSVLGGAGNVVNNLMALGCKVSVASVIGNDDVAHELEDMLIGIGATSHLVKEPGRKTPKKSRIIASHSQVVRYDKESKDDVSLVSQGELVNIFENLCSEVDLVILSDYGKGTLPDALTKSLIKTGNGNNTPVVSVLLADCTVWRR